LSSGLPLSVLKAMEDLPAVWPIQHLFLLPRRQCINGYLPFFLKKKVHFRYHAKKVK